MIETTEGPRDSLIEITWTDPETGTKGFVVLDTLIRGLASGGLRVRKGCTIDEVRGLAQGMSRKEMLVYDPADNYVPLGGGKGGIDFDPSDAEVVNVLSRFVAAVSPVIEKQWTTGEDFGTSQEMLERIFADLGMPSTIEAVYKTLPDADAARQHLADAAAVCVDGIPLMDLVGGYGVAQASLNAARQLNIDVPGATAVVQGFGSIGGAAARYLVANGVKVIAIADRDGLIRDDNGLDVEAMLASRSTQGVVDRSVLTGDSMQLGDRDTWLDVPCDLLVPAAASYVINLADVGRIKARAVIEGANMPTLPDAEAALLKRGIPVIPDFFANVMTNAWWWWIIFGDIKPTARASYAKIDAVAARLAHSVWTDAQSSGCSLRQAAHRHVARNTEQVVASVGITQ